MILRFLALFFIIQTVNGYAQIVVSNNPPMNTEEYIVNNVLLGDDLNTSNYTSVGFANGIGYFDGFNSNIGFRLFNLFFSSWFSFSKCTCELNTRFKVLLKFPRV